MKEKEYAKYSFLAFDALLAQGSNMLKQAMIFSLEFTRHTESEYSCDETLVGVCLQVYQLALRNWFEKIWMIEGSHPNRNNAYSYDLGSSVRYQMYRRQLGCGKGVGSMECRQKIINVHRI